MYEASSFVFCYDTTTHTNFVDLPNVQICPLKIYKGVLYIANKLTIELFFFGQSEILSS